MTGWLRTLLLRARALWRADQIHDEIDEELRFHVQMRTEENLRRGMHPDDARRDAERRFGNLTRAKELAYDVRGARWLEASWRDVRYAARVLRRSPAFSITAVVTLALGVGANTAIFSVVNAVLLEPLPFADPDRVMMVWLRGEKAAGGDRVPLSVADLIDWREQNRAFASVAAFGFDRSTYAGAEAPAQITSAVVTANFFSTLGVPAAAGRTFADDEERPGAHPVAVASHRFWRDRLGSDPAAVGRTVKLDDTVFTLVGVMPESFDFPDRQVEVWTALQLEPPARRGPYWLRGVARLERGVTPDEARADLDAIAARISGETAGPDGAFTVLPVRDYLVGDVRPALLVLFGAVTLVLLIAAANVANLQLVRAAGREREISIRAALGANRARIVRQLLAESLLLALAGGALGAALAVAGLEALVGLTSEVLPRLRDAGIDPVVLGWTLAVTLASGVVSGLAPVLQSTRPNLEEALKEGRRGSGEGSGRRRLRGALVVSEIALAVMLLAAAGLLLKSLWRLQGEDPGFAPDRVLTAQIPLPESRYPEDRQVVDFYDRLLERVSALPGVERAAVGNGIPPDSLAWSDDFVVEGMRVAPDEVTPVANVVNVSPDYFRTLGIRLAGGRYLDETDTADSPPVAVVNETLARRFFPGESAVGKRIKQGRPEQDDPYMEIVGVVADVKFEGLAGGVEPAIYKPSAQNANNTMYLLVKTATDPLGLAGAVGAEVRALDPEVPVARVATLEQRTADSIAQPRLRTALLSVFAALALALAGVGVYGVMAFTVSQRTHEIGVRVALGARTRDVTRLVVGEGMALALAGVAIGLAGALAAGSALASLLYGVSATDPAVLASVPAIVAAVALLACDAPARRAARVDPTVALRGE